MKQFEFIASNFQVPPTVQTAEQLAGLIGRDATWIREQVGVEQRYICNLGDDPAALAAAAAEPIVRTHGHPDLLIYASSSTRQCVPDTSVFVGRLLGLNGVPSYSVNATCLSFLVALQQAAALIQTGDHQRVLIVSAELPSLSRNFADPESAALFGDAAAAVLIGPTQREAGMIRYQQETWPDQCELAQVRGGGLLLHPDLEHVVSDDYRFEMNGEALLRATIPRLKEFLDRFFENGDLKIEDVDWVIPHHASAAGMKILRRLGVLPERTVNVLSQYGNCVAASIPLALAIAHRQGRMQPGERVLFLGTAAGLSIGAALVRW